MAFTEELILKFALFHAERMRDAYQVDCKYFAKQSMAIFIEYNGEIKTAKEWATHLGLAPGAVWNRITYCETTRHTINLD